MSWNESVVSALGHLLARPAADWITTLLGERFATFTALISYVGPVVVALAVWSPNWGWRCGTR